MSTPASRASSSALLALDELTPDSLDYLGIHLSGVSTTRSPGCADHLMAKEDGSAMRPATTATFACRSQYWTRGGW
jgi:hypothetical protein